jgi:predicted transcriptional regulator
MPTVLDAMPNGINGKLCLTKMKKLIKRGLIKGCHCGCRGDFEITQKGIEYLNNIEGE